MVRLSLVASLFAAVASAVTVEQIGNKKGTTRLPGAYIFEFEDESDHADFYSKTSTDGKTRMEFDFKLFKGASIQFNDHERAEEIAAKILELPAVKAMWPVRVYGIPEPRIDWQGTPGQEYATMKKRSASETAKDIFSPHVMTQVDKLREEGYTGKGVKVAVIDSGIDYKHPALGGCFGDGCLVSFGTDLVGDDYNGYNEVNPDDDPMDCQGHGTHVAGILAAQENSMDFTGAAPGVTLGSYRVFGCNGEAGNDVLIAAFNKAYEDGADIITASIGGPSGWSEEAWAVSVSRIVEQGVPCTLAAGNSGNVGMFYASTAASGKGVTAVASFDNTETVSILNVSHYTVNGSAKQEFGSQAGIPAAWTGVKLPLWALNYDTNVTNDACDEFPKGTPDLSGYIVLIRRGTCEFISKATNAAEAGAKYIIVYNNEAGVIPYDVSPVDGIKAAAMVTPEQGEKWIKLLQAGSKVVVEMSDGSDGKVTFEQVRNDLTGGAVSTFTSWGPNWELEAKPQFGAPGGGILSTYPRNLGSYAVLSGTSMATPLMAGIFALISEVRGTLEPELIENLLSASSNPQLFNDGERYYQFLAPVPQQGAGLVQAHDAAHAKVLLSPSSLSFNDTDHFVQSLNFTLKNTCTKDVEFEISHAPAGTTYTLVENSIYPDSFPNEFTSPQATVKFSENKVTVGAGKSVTIEVLPTPPNGLQAVRLPVWSGYIAINGTDGSSLSIPYQGLTGSLHDSKVLGPEDTWISKSSDDRKLPVAENTTFTLPKPGTITDQEDLNSTSAVFPTLVWFLALGSSKLRADVVPVKSNLTNGDFDVPSNGSFGQVVDFPMLWNSMGQNSMPWTGELADGSYAPAGMYKIVYRALRIFGDEKKTSDWDKSESPAFGIKYA
ncbi:peptidase S8/S53 domain-containing protein [Ilyonectria robusta]|uniref:peptidase S8/S53 domain-containing protein n=1 Tax=Ilyonectria robusta TaxID=1079257 RepID=UPI001E8CA2AE|nr:peptidase S8/S53 domain-containing protein [Ilyonectria robusta]KAH8738208.1 peptidase S8/S53 domain-containing protein [Ilyonectria robusta]